MNRAIIPIGPQHPLLKEPLSFTLEMVGETIAAASLRIGYVHRGIEKLSQQRSFAQNVRLFERICGICSHVHTTCYCHAVEQLLGVEIPPRAAYIRLVMCELERIHSHILWLGMLAEAIGFTTIFMYAWRDRELVLDLMEALSGGRVSHAVNVIGGVRVDISAEQARQIETMLTAFANRLELFDDLITRDRSFRLRTEGLGIVSLKDVHDLGVVGPQARASGCTVDLRRDAPYGVYEKVQFEVITATGGDVWSRALVRLEEIRQSLSLCRQASQGLSEGPLSVRVPRRVPAGEAIARVEAPRGELFYYVQSDGGEHPTRVKIRTPTLPTLMALVKLLPGIETADVAAVIAGADLCIACADR
jgi:NADH-quinone oxidoreductase subunit D